MNRNRMAETMLLVVVNYFNDGEVAAFTSNLLLEQDQKEFQIAVVNNGSANATALAGKVSHERVLFLDPGKNLGYLHAFIYACTHVEKASGKMPALCILSNTDIRIPSASALGTIWNIYHQMEFGCMGPRIVSLSQGVEQNPFAAERISRTRLRRINFFQGHYPLYLIYQSASLLRNKWQRLTNSPDRAEGRKEVYALHGAFMVFSGQFLEKAIPQLKQAPFLFGEELYIAEIARELHFRCIYDPGLMIEHCEHATTQTFKKPAMVRYLHASTSQVLERFFNSKHPRDNSVLSS